MAHGGTRNFAELINDIETSAGRHEVLEALTGHFPDEAHFWNHLGRHQIYEMRSDYEKAEKCLECAVQLSLGIHYTSMRSVW